MYAILNKPLSGMNFYNKDKLCFLPSSHLTCIYICFIANMLNLAENNANYLY